MTLNILDPSAKAVDLTDCDREPIQTPGAIQPHGILLTLDPESFRLLQISVNVEERFGLSPEDTLAGGLAAILGTETSEELLADLKRARLSRNPIYLRTIKSPDGAAYHAIGHCLDEVILLELESSPDARITFLRELYPLVSGFVVRMQTARTRRAVLQLAAQQIREITGYDRVLVYEFDRDWNGTVVAEDRNERLPSYLDLRFPASDIPRQARELYRLNPSRVIPDAEYTPSALHPEFNPKTQEPLDLSFAALRSVSPIHREYMKNMGTAASMSFSVLRDGDLWGLISCHNQNARTVPFDVRMACEFVAQVISVQVRAHESSDEYAERVRLKTTETRLLSRMAQQESFWQGLVNSEAELLEFGRAEGAAVVHGAQVALLGHTPSEEQVRMIVEWIAQSAPKEDVVATDFLSSILPAAKEFRREASGLLAVRISRLHRSYVIWFRPETVQTVRWAGDTSAVKTEKVDLHPRKSFEMWKEVVQGRSQPWSKPEIDAAVDLRSDIVGIVLRRAEEMAELTSQLERSNRELEAFSYSVSHDLRAPFRHIVGYAELLRERESDHLTGEGQRYLGTIIESANYAGMLVDNLLNFSRIARTSMTLLRVNMNELVRDLVRELATEARQRSVEWEIAELPEVIADPVLLRLAVRNLLSNAVKYTRQRETAKIAIQVGEENGHYVFSIQDNGAGFDMKYVDKLYGVFQRLHRMEEYEGTGIGLANVRRIIDRHGGRTWAEGKPGQGATFHFSLPRNGPEQDKSA